MISKVDPVEFNHVTGFIELFTEHLKIKTHTITGGFPRDIAMGRKPKDIDVLIVTELSPTELIDKLSGINTLRKPAGAQFEVYEAYGGDSQNHFKEWYVTCLKMTVEDRLPVDFLFLRGGDTDATISSFDCSLNRGICRHDGTISGLDLSKFEYTGGTIDRFYRLSDMYVNYKWGAGN